MTKLLIFNLMKTDVIIDATKDKLRTNGLDISIAQGGDGIDKLLIFFVED